MTKHVGLYLFTCCQNITVDNHQKCGDVHCILMYFSLGDAVSPQTCVAIFRWIKEAQYSRAFGVLPVSRGTSTGFTLCPCSAAIESIANKLLVSLPTWDAGTLPRVRQWVLCRLTASSCTVHSHPKCAIALSGRVLCHRIALLCKPSVLRGSSSEPIQVYFESSSVFPFQ